jgi:hypothetical protein
MVNLTFNIIGVRLKRRIKIVKLRRNEMKDKNTEPDRLIFMASVSLELATIIQDLQKELNLSMNEILTEALTDWLVKKTK